MTTTYIDNDEFKHHLDGQYHEKLDLFSVCLSTTYTECRFPDEKRRQFQVNLTNKELDIFINGLLEIRSGRKS